MTAAVQMFGMVVCSVSNTITLATAQTKSALAVGTTMASDVAVATVDMSMLIQVDIDQPMSRDDIGLAAGVASRTVSDAATYLHRLQHAAILYACRVAP